MQIAWHGHYLDGRTANKVPAEVQLLNEGLRVTTPSGGTFLWPYGEIRQTQGFYGNEPVQLERGGKLPEILVIAEAGFLADLHRYAPHPAKRFHDPARRARRVRLTVGAAVGIVALCLSGYLWGIPLLAEAVTPHIPPAWEKGLGESALGILAPAESLCGDPELQKALDEMVARLAGGEAGAFRVHVVKSPLFNAVALPGGHIVVFGGLLEKTDSPEALAAVLAHEMQHIKKRHITRRIIEDSSTGIILSAVSGDITGAALYGVKVAHSLAMLSYSRRDEEEADAEGVKMVLKADLDPAAMIRFFETLREKEGGREIPQYLSTHPDLGERISRLKTLIARAKTGGQVYRRLSSGPDWDRLRRKCDRSGGTGAAVH